MGEAANTGDGGAYPRDGGAGDASAVRRRGRAARPAAQHTAAGRRVRAGRAPATTSPLSGTHHNLSKKIVLVHILLFHLGRMPFMPYLSTLYHHLVKSRLDASSS